MSPYLYLIPALPLLASVLIALLGPWLLRGRSHWLCIASAAAACVLALLTLRGVAASSDAVLEHRYYTWFTAGAVQVDFSLRADPLSAIMLLAITFIGTLIAVFSAGYMHGEEGCPRYFAIF